MDSFKSDTLKPSPYYENKTLQPLKALFQNPTFQRYFYNSSWMMAEQILRIVSGVFVGIYIARYLGPERYGVFSYALSICAFVLAIARMGMDSTLTRELVGTKDIHTKAQVLMGTAFWMMSAAALLCYLTTILIFWGLDESIEIKVFIVILCSSAFFTSFLSIDYFFQSQLKAKYSAICKSLALLAGSILKLVLLSQKAEILWFVIASVLDHVVLAVFLLYAARSTYNLNFVRHFSFADARVMIHSSWPMVLTAVASLIFMRIDQIMIRHMLGLHELGIYSAAIKVYESWIILPYVISISLLPAIVKLKQGDETEYHRKLCQLFRVVIWLSVLAALVTTLFSTSIMTIAFGVEYAPSASVLTIVMWTSIFSAMNSVSARYLTVEKMEKKVALRTLYAAALNIALNAIVIPIYGVDGAAAATLVCVFLTAYAMDWLDRELVILRTIKNKAIFKLNN